MLETKVAVYGITNPLWIWLRSLGGNQRKEDDDKGQVAGYGTVCRLGMFKNSLNTFASSNPAMRSRAGVLQGAGCGMAGGRLWEYRRPCVGCRRRREGIGGRLWDGDQQREAEGIRRRLGPPAMAPLRGVDDGVYDGVYDGGNGGLYGGAPAVADQAAGSTAYAALSHSAPYAHSRSHKAAAGRGGRLWEERWPAMGEGPGRG